jgi:hypothetical protein
MRIFLAEWRKLKRPAFFFGTMGSVIFVTGLVTSLLFLLIDAKTGNADRGNRITREMLQLSDGFTIGFNSSNGLLGLVALSVSLHRQLKNIPTEHCAICWSDNLAEFDS